MKNEHAMPELQGANAVQIGGERDPNGVPANTPGAKMDAGKSPVMRGAIQYFPRALRAVADVSAFGASKYTWNGWESVPDGVHRYSDALARHLLAEAEDGPITEDSGLLHAAHVAWNALARLELMLRAEHRRVEQRMATLVAEVPRADSTQR